LSQIGHKKTQQDQGDKTPKYPSPRLMTAAVDGRFFGFLTHSATANSIFSISVVSLSSARKLSTRFAPDHWTRDSTIQSSLPPQRSLWFREPMRLLARSERFELPTPRFEVWCSIQLSYERRSRTLGH